ELREIPARDILDRDVAAAFLLHRRLENRRDMRVRDPPGERRLVQELPRVRLVEILRRDDSGVEDLQRYILAAERVEREVDRSGSALAEHSAEREFSKLPDHRPNIPSRLTR